MPIDLGLSRVTRLLKGIGDPHKSTYHAIHIAGTNGKGSTVAYLSSVLTQAGINNGRFTSPSTISYNDCVCINNEVYPMNKFQVASEMVKREDKTLGLNCTEFELLTVTAFKIFELERVHVAVIEVGLGGRLDATNVLEPALFINQAKRSNSGVIATGITKMGIDHEAFLGSTLSSIAHEKAGIIKNCIPCVLDRTNEAEAINEVRRTVLEKNAPLYLVDGIRESTLDNGSVTTVDSGFDCNAVKEFLNHSPLLGRYQLQNLSVAIKILEIISSQSHEWLYGALGVRKISRNAIIKGIEKTYWPGRLQNLSLSNFDFDVLVDGAHNESAAIALNEFLNTMRDRKSGIIFVIAMTKGKSPESLLKNIIQDHDTVITTEFTLPENMPWVKCYSSNELAESARLFCKDVIPLQTQSRFHTIFKYIRDLKHSSGDKRPVVICGSLYLCSDVLRYAELIKGV